MTLDTAFFLLGLWVVASPAAQAQGTRGMVFAQMEAPAAGHIMGPAAHGEAADAVSRSLARLL